MAKFLFIFNYFLIIDLVAVVFWLVVDWGSLDLFVMVLDPDWNQYKGIKGNEVSLFVCHV